MKELSIVLAHSRSQKIATIINKRYLICLLYNTDIHTHKFFPNMPFVGLSLTHTLDFMGIKGNVDRRHLKQF